MTEAAPETDYSTWNKDGNPATIVLGWYHHPPNNGRWAGWFVMRSQTNPRFNGRRIERSQYLLDVRPGTRIQFNRALCGQLTVCLGRPRAPQSTSEVEWPCPGCVRALDARRRAKDGALEALV